MAEWHFVCDSDVHATADGALRMKPNLVTRLVALDKERAVDFVLCVGDLTDHGLARARCGETGFFGCLGACIACACVRGDELATFIDYYETPLERAGFPVKLCPGNHDAHIPGPRCHKGVFDHIAKKHGATTACEWRDACCYSFVHKGVHFLCLGVYPHNLAWLRAALPRDTAAPLVLFYHYNTVPDEAFSNWWTPAEKNAFYGVIKGHNVALIVNGHLHATGDGMWRGIRVVRGAGDDKFALVGFRGTTLTSVEFR